MKRTLFIILSVVAVFLFIGVAFARLAGPKVGNTYSTINSKLPGGYGGGGAPESRGLREPALAPAAPAYDSAVSGSTDAYNGAGQPAQEQERLVIKTANLSIVVKDLKSSMSEISNLAKEFGGYVASSNLYQDTSTGREIPQATVEIRVPSEKLDEALTRIKKGAVDVPSESLSGQDVTKEYVDLQARLTAKQAAEKKLLEIMDQAVRAEDVLAVYLQVQNVQTEIEQLKGQIKYYEESAAMSSISVTLIAEASTQPIEVGPWKPQGAVKESIQDLIVFFQNFVDFLIFFVLNILPKMILIAIPLYLLYLVGRAVYRRFVKAESKAEEVKG